MKAITIGVYNPKHIHQASPYCGDNVFAKGLEQNGFQVSRLDYRDDPTPNTTLLELANYIKPTLFWFGKCEKITWHTLSALREKHSDAVFVKWAADVRTKPVPFELAFNQYMDWYFPTFGGYWLKRHLNDKMVGVASIVAFTDSSYYKPIEIADTWNSDVLFTGRTNMEAEVNRAKILNYILEEGINLKWYGQKNWIQHPEYLKAINGAKIGLGINHFVRPLYTSDRLANYISCGTFFLSQYFPGIQNVFNKDELSWFKTKKECVEKIKYYLKEEEERKSMAKKARKKVLKYFDSKPLVENLLHIINKGKSKYPWDYVYKN